MPPILFPASTAPGKDQIESAGRLINCYAETLQEGAPAQRVTRRVPGLTLFGASSQTGIRGLWYDGSTAVYAAYTSNLSWFDSNGVETVIGGIPDGTVAYSGSFASTANLSSYTLTPVPFGDAHADRRMVVGTVATEYEGPELITNGAFTTDLTGWTVGTEPGTIFQSWQYVGVGFDPNPYAAKINGPDGQLTQNITTVAGRIYRLRVTARSGFGGSGVIRIYWGGSFLGQFASPGGVTTWDMIASVTGVTQIGFNATVFANDVGIDDVSIKLVQFAQPTAVTIGGIAATQVANATFAALWVANVPTGTSGSIALTYPQTMNDARVAVWRLGGVPSNTPIDTDATTALPGAATLNVTRGSASIFMVQYQPAIVWTPVGVTVNAQAVISSLPNRFAAFSGFAGSDGTTSITANANRAAIAAAAWQGTTSAFGNGAVTFAKNNKVPTPDQVLVASGAALVSFTKLAISAPINVNSETPTSVCFGEGYFFVTTVSGRCYASGINALTFNSLDSVRAEQRPESLTRGVFYNGELYLFGPTHIEVYASRGSPNPTGFPLNFITAIWRGISGTLAVTGFEEGFEGGLFWVADDHSVRMLQGYQAKTISTPALERAIETCGNKAEIRAECYDVDGHACVVIDLAGEGTWVYDITEGGLWHERSTADTGAWRATGNSVHGFDVWITGNRYDGNLYQIDETSMDDGDYALPFIVESIAMEAFPLRLKVSRVELNFVPGVGTPTVPDPMVKVSWSDTGGHRWSDPMERKLGEAGRYYEHIRINGLGMTGQKGRRFRVRIDDEVTSSLLAGSMETASTP